MDSSEMLRALLAPAACMHGWHHILEGWRRSRQEWLDQKTFRARFVLLGLPNGQSKVLELTMILQLERTFSCCYVLLPERCN